MSASTTSRASSASRWRCPLRWAFSGGRAPRISPSRVVPEAAAAAIRDLRRRRRRLWIPALRAAPAGMTGTDMRVGSPPPGRGPDLLAQHRLNDLLDLERLAQAGEVVGLAPGHGR